MVLWSFGLISALPPRRGRVPWTSVVLVTLRETARLLLGAAAAGRAYQEREGRGIYRYLAVMFCRAVRTGTGVFEAFGSLETGQIMAG
jgi:hypothetical protein